MVDQRVMEHLAARGDVAGKLAAEHCDEILVLTIGAKEVPVQHGQQGVSGHDDGDHHQGQAPDFDVVQQEHDHTQEHHQRQECGCSVKAEGVFGRVGNGQANQLGKFDFGGQRLGHHAGAVAGDNVQQANGFDFNDVRQRQGSSSRHQRDIERKPGVTAQARLVRPAAPQRVLERHDQHHQKEDKGVEPLGLKPSDPKELVTRHAFPKRIPPRNTRCDVQQAHKNQSQPKPKDQLGHKCFLWGFFGRGCLRLVVHKGNNSVWSQWSRRAKYKSPPSDGLSASGRNSYFC